MPSLNGGKSISSALPSFLFCVLELTQLSYDALKKQLYHLEKQQTGPDSRYRDLESHEDVSLIRNNEADTAFTQSLDHELRKISAFYDHQAKEILEEVAEVEELVQQQDESAFNGNDAYSPYQESDDEDEDEEEHEDDDVPNNTPGRSKRRTSVTFSPDTRGTGMFQYQFCPPSLKHRINVGKKRRSSSARRHSVSSSEGGNADLETSISSRQVGGSWRGNSTSKSPRISTRGLVNTFTNIRESLTASGLLPETIWTSNSDYALDTRLLFKRRITNLYVSASSLKSYVELNYSGFRKVLKKWGSFCSVMHDINVL